MNTESFKAAIDTFCRMNGIDPTSKAVEEFRCALLSEISGALCKLPGMAAEYVKRHVDDVAIVH